MEPKKCEVCSKVIPDDFVNLLCIECYNRQAQEAEAKKLEEAPEVPQNIQPIDEPSGKAAESLENAEVKETQSDVELEPTAQSNRNGITDPNYQENPEAEDKEQVMANIGLFIKNGVLLWHPTRMMYEFIKNRCIKRATEHPQYPKFVWKPTIVDVGCGSGVGSNILSQEADFVWGIDKNETSIKFAQQAFTRVKNGIYYNSHVSFDQFDLINETRETMKFDVVVAIEVIEHIYDYRKFLQRLTSFDTRAKENPTEYYISTPNRNNKNIQKDRPYNKYHVREYTSQEFVSVLSEFFKDIELFSSAGEPAPIDTNHTPILAKCKLK